MPKFTFGGSASEQVPQNIPQPVIPENGGFFDTVSNYFNKNIIEPVKENIGSHLAQTAQHISEIPGKFVEHAKGVPGDIRSLGRAVATAGPNLIEGAVSGPGSLADLALGVGNKYISNSIPTYEDVQGKFPPLKLLPTTEQAHEVTKKVIGDKFEPITHGEELYDEVMRSIGMIGLNPVSAVNGFPNLFKAVGGVLAGKGAKETVRHFGGGPGLQAAADIGFSWLTTMPNIAKHLESMETPAWNAVKSTFKKGDMFGANKIKDSLLNIGEESSIGLSTKAKDFVAEKTVEFAKKLKDQKGNPIFEGAKLKADDLPEVLDHLKNMKTSPNLNIEELLQTRKDINKFLRSKTTPSEAKPALMKLKKTLKTTSEEYGRKNPEFINSLNKAESITFGLKNRSDINNFLQNNITLKDSITNDALKLLLTGGTALIKGGKTAGLGIAGAVALKNVTKVAEMIAQSKPLAREWGKLMASTGVGNIASATSSLKKLNQVANREAPNNKFKMGGNINLPG